MVLQETFSVKPFCGRFLLQNVSLPEKSNWDSGSKKFWDLQFSKKHFGGGGELVFPHAPLWKTRTEKPKIGFQVFMENSINLKQKWYCVYWLNWIVNKKKIKHKLEVLPKNKHANNEGSFYVLCFNVKYIFILFLFLWTPFSLLLKIYWQ